MPLVTRQKREIYQHGVDLFKSAGLSGASVKGTPEETFISFVTDEVFALHKSIQQVYDAHHLSTATGADLAEIGKLVGVARKTSTTAHDPSPVTADSPDMNFVFYIDSQASGASTAKRLLADFGAGVTELVIPANTRLSDGGEKVYYTTREVRFDPDADKVGAPVIAAGSGKQYNVDANELTSCNLSNTGLPANVTRFIRCTNRLPIDSGQERESDEDLRFRIAQAYIAKAAGNEKAILDAARNVPGVRDAFLIPYIYGTGTMGVFVESSTPVVSRGTMNAVQAAVDQMKSGGNRMYTLYPRFLGVGMKVEIRPVPGATLSQFSPEIKQQIREYINSLDRGETLIISKITAIVAGHSQVADGNVSLLNIGDYNIDTQTRENVSYMIPVNQEATSTERWYTAEQYLELCEV